MNNQMIFPVFCYNHWYIIIISKELGINCLVLRTLYFYVLCIQRIILWYVFSITVILSSWH